MIWRCRDRAFDLSRSTLVMGVVNVTPDSFSDGGRFLDPERAADQARRLATEGADLVDLGAESTRPGSTPVPPEEQIRRLSPVFERLAGEKGIALSVDTSSAAVARQALEAGIHVINDVTGLGDPAMAPLVASSGAGVVLMHMRGNPARMQEDPSYEDASSEIASWLAERVARAVASGIAADQIVLDPGIGFGKTVRHNLELIARLDEIAALGRPLLVGVSRKGFIGKILDLPADQRIEGSLAATAVAVFLGARIVRAHDVPATVRAVRMAEALHEARRAGLGIEA